MGNRLSWLTTVEQSIRHGILNGNFSGQYCQRLFAGLWERIPLRKRVSKIGKITGSWDEIFMEIKILDIWKFHIFALRWRDEIRRSSQLRTLLKRVVVNRTWKKKKNFTTTRFSSVLSCEDLLISFMEIVFENVNLIDIFSRITF